MDGQSVGPFLAFSFDKQSDVQGKHQTTIQFILVDVSIVIVTEKVQSLEMRRRKRIVTDFLITVLEIGQHFPY